MQKWEYLAIRPNTVNAVLGTKIGGEYAMRLPQYENILNSLGDEGWELVTDAEPGMHIYIFKRPKISS